MKNPLTPAGFEPATFRFVAQHIIILYREIIAVCSQIHTKRKYTVWAERRNVERSSCGYGTVHTVTTVNVEAFRCYDPTLMKWFIYGRSWPGTGCPECRGFRPYSQPDGGILTYCRGLSLLHHLQVIIR